MSESSLPLTRATPSSTISAWMVTRALRS